MRSKGQTVNIDWTVGLSLFVVTALTAVLFLTNINIGPEPVPALEAKAFQVQQNLEDETFVEGSTIPMISRGPVSVNNIPVDTFYNFSAEAYTDSESGDIPVEMDIANNRIVTVTDAGNQTKSLVYFHENVSDITYTNDISTGSNWINNSKIAVETGNNGLISLRISGNELLNPDADLNSASFSTTEKELYAETLSGDLRIYNGSPEIIFDNISSNVTFNLQNLNTLYWHQNKSTVGLSGTGVKAEGKTKGFTVASGYGITFIGNLTATVSKPDSSTVQAEIDAEKIRIRLHNSDYQTGRKRIRAHDAGYVTLGASKSFSASYSSKIQDLKNETSSEFEDKVNLEDFGYNISFGKTNTSTFIERGKEVPIDTSAVVSDRSSALIDRNGTLSEIENRVILWR